MNKNIRGVNPVHSLRLFNSEQYCDGITEGKQYLKEKKQSESQYSNMSLFLSLKCNYGSAPSDFKFFNILSFGENSSEA